MDKVFINSTQITCKDNQGNVTFNTNDKFLKTNSSNSTSVGRLISRRTPCGTSDSKSAYVSAYDLSMLAIYNTNFVDKLFANTAYNFDMFIPKGYQVLNSGLYYASRPIFPVNIHRVSDSNKIFLQQKIGTNWVTLYGSPLRAVETVLYPQGPGMPPAAHYFWIAPVALEPSNIETIIQGQGTGYYRLRLNSDWNLNWDSSGGSLNVASAPFALYHPMIKKSSELIDGEITL